MHRALFCLVLAATATFGTRAALLPLEVGTTWEYEVAGVNNGEATKSTLTVQIHGKETSKGKELLRFDTLSNDELVKTELLAVTDAGIMSYERTSKDGIVTPYDPPQTLVPAPLKVGAKWEVDDVVAGSEMHQTFAVTAEEEVAVPAGKFRAFRLHCEQPWPISIEIERWFAPGTGLVKEIVATRGPGGRLMSRTTAALQKLSEQPIKSQPPVAPVAAPPAAPIKINLEVAKERDGKATTEFRSDAPSIFVRWSGENLPVDQEVRIAWIAEDVGDVAEPNFVVDEVRSTITRPDYSARFTLSRPQDGWAPGKYRLEIYLEDELKEKLAVTIRE